jgi:putative hemolysin
MLDTERERSFVMTPRTKMWWMMLVFGLVFAACGGTEKNDDTGLANPASVYCESQGGTVEIVTDAEGNQSGRCHLSDGTVVDEWEYYRQSQATGAGLANPAAVFCEEHGGTVSGVEPMCALPDGTVVDAWQYFRVQSGIGQ